MAGSRFRAASLDRLGTKRYIFSSDALFQPRRASIIVSAKPSRYFPSSGNMANPNPSPKTRFTSDSPARGRQKGARDRLSAAFLTALANTFEELNDKGDSKGLDALRKVRDEDPAAYARVVASLLPKEVEIKRPLDELSDEDLAYLIATLKERVPAPAADDAEPAGTTPTIN
jgi:hypothetical protein